MKTHQKIVKKIFFFEHFYKTFSTIRFFQYYFHSGQIGGHIQLDGTLIDDLFEVGLATEDGNIRIRELTADLISLSSSLGDIIVEGIDGKFGILYNFLNVHLNG